MSTRAALLAGAAMTAAGLGYAWVLYPSLPALIPIHWNIHGQVDGWAPKEWAALMLPGMMVVMLGMLVGLPWLSPRQFDVAAFRGTFNYVMVLAVGLMGYIHVVSLQAALHPEMESGRVLVGGLFLFFAAMGNVLGRVRRNFWMGIRTPWTLASDAVWDATHRLAARLMFGAGLLGGLAVLLGAPVAPCFVILMIALLYPTLHSLLLYKRLEGER